MKVILYYQTFSDLSPILIENSPVTHIHLSALHFGENENGDPYIHLNDYSPYNDKFDSVWLDMARANQLGIKVKIMLGGAGGAYNTLFSNFSVYYSFLKELIQNKSFISGIDLDVEEETSLENIKILMRALKRDFGPDFTISFAPIQYALQSDVPGLGGFSYKDLLKSKEGYMIDYFNGQFYNDYSEDSYNQVIENGYNPNGIIMGVEGVDNIEDNLKIIHNLYLKYGDNFGGVFLWEYYMGPSNWASRMKNAMKHTYMEKWCTIL